MLPVPQVGAMDAVKYPKKSVSFPPKLLADAEERAGGNFSGYLQSLVTRDLANRPIDGMRDDVMEYLTEKLLGGRHLARLRPLLAGVDQRDELARVMEDYIARNEKPAHNRMKSR